MSENDPGTYDLFLQAVKHRPIRFEVKRPITAAGTKFIAGTLHALHRFVITKPGSIGMSLGSKGNTTYVSSVLPNSLSDVHGVFKDDIVCIPFTNGKTDSNFSWICHYYATHSQRPLVVEVWRPVAPVAGILTRCLPNGGNSKNPFMFAFPPTMPSKNAYRGEAVPTKLTCHEMEVAKGQSGKECPPVILLVDDSDDASEDNTGGNK